MSCPACGSENFKKVFSFMPGANMSTIRQLSERDPQYWAWLNSDKVKADVKAGKLRPIGKHEDQAHGGGGDDSAPYETPREQEAAWAKHERDFIAAGCPDIDEQRVLASQGKL